MLKFRYLKLLLVALLCCVVTPLHAAPVKTAHVDKKIATPKANKQTKVAPKGLAPVVKKEEKKTVISFPWKEDTASAAFIRGDRLWIVFDKDTKVDLAEKSDEKWFSELKKEEIKEYGSFFTTKINRKNNALPNVLMYRKGNTWLVEFSESKIKPQDIRVVSRPLAAPFPKVDIEMGEKANEAIRFEDPYIGDTLAVIPVSVGAKATNTQYGFVDFKVLKSVQGVVIQLIADAISITSADHDIEIKGAIGLNIAPHIFEKRTSKYDSGRSSFKLDYFVEDFQSILSLKSYVVSDEDFLPKLYGLRMVANKTKSKKKRAKIYANMALFYLANKLYTEALVALSIVKIDDPEFAESYNIKLIEAATLFMQKEYAKAYDIVKKIKVYSVPISLRNEIRFWQAIVDYALSDSEGFFNQIDPSKFYADQSNSFLSEYTDAFLLEFGLFIARNKIEEEQFAKAMLILKKLLKMGTDSRNKNRIYYTAANYYAKRDKSNKAIEFWDKCIDDVLDRFNRQRCRFAKANYLNDRQRMSLAAYTRELESVAQVWRGDDFEVDVLKKLGDTYYDLKEYAHALRTWKKVVTFFPYTADSLLLTRRMSKTFVEFFEKGKDDTLPPLKALALFYEFQNLLPVGEMGDRLIIKFTDHLIALDLLDRAAALLNHQVTQRLQSTYKEEVINKLANVHIMNNNPQFAIDVINIGDDYSELPDDIAKERKFIHAKALHLNKQNDEALKLLKLDLSPEADELKSSIYWSMRDWKELNKYIEPYIYSIRYNDQKLTSDDAAKTLKLSLSYLMLGEKQLLDDLYKDFKNRLPKDSRYTNILNVLAITWKEIEGRGMESQKNIKAIEDLVNKLTQEINKK